MPKLVVQGASLTCSMGNAPSQLSVLPANMVNGPSSMTAATVQDSKPNVNLMPFGMCMSPSNPQVAAATAAALGVLTPQPCVPMTMAVEPGLYNGSDRGACSAQRFLHLSMHVGWNHHDHERWADGGRDASADGTHSFQLR
jgi:hypothetical protein